MQNILLVLFYITSFYAFIPGVITRFFGFRVFRRGKAEHHYALTFDDGPDPTYTPQLLDLLGQYGVKATFFVVGNHAEKHPELVKRINAEGHLIGIHNYNHNKSNWFMHPGTVRKQVKRTDHIIESITGSHSSYYRPPWGIMNLFDIGHSHYKIVLWSSMFGDWRKKVGADELTKRMLKKLNPGEVMLLHDCGMTPGADPEAPGQMLIALERVLKEAEKRGLSSIRIDELIKQTEKAPESKLSRSKLAVVKLWLMWEMVFHWMFQLRTVTPEDPFLHYRKRRYQGNTVVMDNGEELRKGDQVIELHFDNQKLFRIGVYSRSTMQLAIKMIRSMEKELPTLVGQIQSDPSLAEAKALYGVSMINRGPEKFGFSIRDLPGGLFARSTQIYLKILLSIIHPTGQKRLKERSEKLVPKLMLLPMNQLLSTYGHSTEQAEELPKDTTATVKLVNNTSTTAI